MEIALPAIIIFLLVSPGFIFRAQFKRAERETFDYSPFGIVVGQAFLWTLVLHGLWLTITWWVFNSALDIKTLMQLLSPTSQQENASSFDAVSEDVARITSYFVSLYVFCWFVPLALRKQIVKYRLDREDFPLSWLLRMDAPWYYLLQGANLTKKPAVVFISVLVDVSGKAILYYGILVSYTVDRHTGELNRIVLSGVFRWELEGFDQAKTPEDKMKISESIDGNCLVISYDETITLNIKYLHEFTDTEQPPPDPGKTDAQPDQ